MSEDPARARWFIMVFARLAGAGGAVLGVLLLAEGDTPRKLLGGALMLASLWVMAIVPRALARRWRSPE